MGLHSPASWILPVLLWIHGYKAAPTSSNLAKYSGEPSPAVADSTGASSRFLAAAHRRRRASVDEADFETRFETLPDSGMAEGKLDVEWLFDVIANREATSPSDAIDVHAVNTNNDVGDGGVTAADFKRNSERIPLRKRELNAMERAVIRKEILRRLEGTRNPVEMPIGLRFRRTHGLSSGIAFRPQRNPLPARYPITPWFQHETQPRHGYPKWTSSKSQIYL